MSRPGGLAGAWLDWSFRSRATGRITVAQTPNGPLLAFAILWLAALLPAAESRAASLLRLGADLCLVVWAADEILRGVNPFRRALGASVLLYLAWQRLA